jgi:hypothetical protein
LRGLGVGDLVHSMRQRQDSFGKLWGEASLLAGQCGDSLERGDDLRIVLRRRLRGAIEDIRDAIRQGHDLAVRLVPFGLVPVGQLAAVHGARGLFADVMRVVAGVGRFVALVFLADFLQLPLGFLHGLIEQAIGMLRVDLVDLGFNEGDLAGDRVDHLMHLRSRRRTGRLPAGRIVGGRAASASARSAFRREGRHWGRLRWESGSADRIGLRALRRIHRAIRGPRCLKLLRCAFVALGFGLGDELHEEEVCSGHSDVRRESVQVPLFQALDHAGNFLRRALPCLRAIVSADA